MKITILWSSLASYSVAFFKELAITQNCRLQLIYQGTKSDAPYKKFDLAFCHEALQDSRNLKLEKLVTDFSPDCVLMCSWSFPHFMRITRKLRRQGVFVVSGMDNQWHGTIKQRLGVLSSRWFLKPSIDTFLVAGDRQAYFARKLGYDNVLYGYASAEVNRFITDLSINERPKNFLFVGRLISVKGVKNLTLAYRNYRKQTADPWGLQIVGTGELQYLLENVQGVKLLGFVQPDQLPVIMQNASCFVLPSFWEPWGVVIHEATASGLPVIATYPCGAVTAFVRDGVNGYLIPPRPEPLADAMLRISTCDDTELEQMSQASLTLAKLWTPQKLAEYFVASVKRLLSSRKTS
ncbi:glycosyltransferase family 4 protein [Desulfobacterales bacterium HSG2]|nr:glycosyltransferase family 4 protein [Desulfobacterales bacterium HSG2]